MSSRTEPADDALLRTSAEWFVRLQSNEPSSEELDEWQQWLAADPAHRQAYQAVEDFWQLSAQIARPPQARAGGRQRRTFPRLTAIAAALVLMTTAGALLLVTLRQGPLPDTSAVRTEAAVRREYTLSDGSRVVLGAQSRLTVDFSASARNVVIDSGAAYFEVAHDAARPFIVRAGNGSITAVGTAFNVWHLPGQVVVTVVEGAVDVADVHLEVPAFSEAANITRSITRVQAGQEIVYGPVSVSVQTVDTAIATAWLGGRLQYLNEPLEFVIPDVARHTRRQLVIADPEIGQMRYTGTVLPNEVDDWLTSIGEAFPIDVVSVSSDTVMLKARAAVE